jgi:hypothetical protein
MAPATSSPITSASSKSGNLVKATLISLDEGVPQIEFMFNPTELVFEGVVETSESPGARTEDKGTPKVSFSHVKAYKVTINKILFDTYEEGGDVEFVKGKERPPIYQFMWGKQVYLRRCFIEKLNYKLTMFLPDGTPVRAVIDSLTLKEADESNENGPLGAKRQAEVDRQTDSFANRKSSSGKKNQRTSKI